MANDIRKEIMAAFPAIKEVTVKRSGFRRATAYFHKTGETPVPLWIRGPGFLKEMTCFEAKTLESLLDKAKRYKVVPAEEALQELAVLQKEKDAVRAEQDRCDRRQKTGPFEWKGITRDMVGSPHCSMFHGGGTVLPPFVVDQMGGLADMDVNKVEDWQKASIDILDKRIADLQARKAEIQNMDVPVIKEALQSAKEYAARYIETGIEE